MKPHTLQYGYLAPSKKWKKHMLSGIYFIHNFNIQGIKYIKTNSTLTHHIIAQ
jgi:hypothetical protein